jgi:hypothetical protein
MEHTYRTSADDRYECSCGSPVCLLCRISAEMELLERGSSVVDWIGLAQDRYRWRALVISVMNLRVP